MNVYPFVPHIIIYIRTHNDNSYLSTLTYRTQLNFCCEHTKEPLLFTSTDFVIIFIRSDSFTVIYIFIICQIGFA